MGLFTYPSQSSPFRSNEPQDHTLGETTWNDRPITNASEDTLGRAAFAKKVALFINRCTASDDSIVFGLTGEWGAGKTSIISMVTQELSACSDIWRISEFSPWAASSPNGVMEDFFAALGEAVPEVDRKTLAKSLSSLYSIAAQAIQLGTNSHLGSLSLRPPGLPSNNKSELEEFQSWRTSFDKASKLIARSHKKILIVVDDVDRLQKDELSSLLKTIRLLGRFPNIHYLMAYDEASLSEIFSGSSLDQNSQNIAERFLEKIVQFPIAIPPLSEVQILDTISKELESIRGEHTKNEIPLTRSGTEPPWHNIDSLLGTFCRALRTPRAINRFLANARINVDFSDPGEINVGDCIALAFLRVIAPQVHAEIGRNKETLCHKSYKEEHRKRVINSVSAIATIAPSQRQSAVEEVLNWLFLGPMPADKGIVLPEYFDRYFQFGITGFDVSDTTISTAVESAISKNPEVLLELLQTSNQHQIKSILIKLNHFSSLSMNTDQKLAFLMHVIPIATNCWVSQSVELPEQMLVDWIYPYLASLRKDMKIPEAISALDRISNGELLAAIFQRLESSWEMDNIKREDVAWMMEAIPIVNSQLCSQFLDGLREDRDHKAHPSQNRVLEYIGLYGGFSQLKVSIINEIELGNIDGGDVASRCYQIWKATSNSYQTNRLAFNMGLYRQLVPTELDSWRDNVATDENHAPMTWGVLRYLAADILSEKSSDSNQ